MKLQGLLVLIGSIPPYKRNFRRKTIYGSDSREKSLLKLNKWLDKI